MIKKEKIPITLFEKFKAIILVINPGFFNDSVPDVQKFERIVAKLHTRIYALTDNERKALAAFAIMFKSNLETEMERLSSAIQYLKSIECTGDKENLEKAIDDLYLCKTLTILNPDGTFGKITNDLIETSVADNVNKLMWTFHRFDRRGRKTFRLEEQLTNELYITDVKNVDSSFLKFPYPTLCIYVPFNTKLKIRNRLIRYMYVSEVMMVGGEFDQQRKIRIDYITEDEGIENVSFHIGPGFLLEQIEDQSKEFWNGSKLALKESNEAISFVLATMLYINSSEVSYQDIAPIVFQKKTDSRFPVCSLGYNISVDRRLHYANTNKDPEKHMNVLKWTVRGHYRNYKKSERFKENKIVWIRPYIKGREREVDDQVIKPTNYLVS